MRIAHLYPRDMNLYGDGGNVMVLAKRLSWRGHAVAPMTPDRQRRVCCSACKRVL